MSNNNKGEMRHILDMVSDGKITPDEGAKLLSAIDENKAETVCPYCAEKIKSGINKCPECKSNLGQGLYEQTFRDSGERSFHTVGGLSKTLIIYMIVVTAIILIFSLSSLGNLSIFPMLLAGMGLTAAILMCKGRNSGWILGLIWSALQIIEIIVNRFPINRQFFYIGAYSLRNGDGVGINVVGIVLLILFIAVKNEWVKNEQNNYMR